MNGYFLEKFDKQIKALNVINSTILNKIPLDSWAFGGGTALSLFHFNHRLSFDIDIFVNDPQYFAFLSPKFYIDEHDSFSPNYLQQAHHISLKTIDGIKVDFLLSPDLTDDGKEIKNISDTKCYVHSTDEIIAKKIKYRNNDNIARDIFDIAFAVKNDNKLLKKLCLNKAIEFTELMSLKHNLVNKFDEKKYKQEIKKVIYQDRYKDIAFYGNEIIIKSIERFEKIFSKQWDRDVSHQSIDEKHSEVFDNQIVEEYLKDYKTQTEDLSL